MLTFEKLNKNLPSAPHPRCLLFTVPFVVSLLLLLIYLLPADPALNWKNIICKWNEFLTELSQIFKPFLFLKRTSATSLISVKYSFFNSWILHKILSLILVWLPFKIK